MANDIQLKRSSVSGRVPDAANVLVGEPVVNLADKIIFTKDGTGNVIVIGAGTTSNVVEGSNLYFSNARVYANVAPLLANISTGTPVYFQNTAPSSPVSGSIWINSDTSKEYLYFNDGTSLQWVEQSSTNYTINVSSLTTARVTETTNLYFTNSRVYSNVVELNYITAASLNGYATNAQLTPFATNSNLVLKANVIDLTTANVAELNSLYYTNARVYANVTERLANLDTNVYPAVSEIYSLGSPTRKFKDLYLSGNTILLGDTTLSSTANGLTVSAISSNSWTNLYTANVLESSGNLYYTDSRVYTAVTGNLALKANVVDLTTANVTELGSLYYTNSRVYAAVTGNLALKANVVDLTTANVTELDNLYYTNSRVYTAVTGNLALKANVADLTTSNVTEGSNLYFSNARVSTAISSQTLTNATFSSDVTIGGTVNITGNLNVTGNVTTFAANTIEIADTMIYLATNNSGDAQDIGIVGHFTNPDYQHTGLVRDASDGVWKLFANVQTEPSSNVLDFTTATYSALKIGALQASTGTFTGNVSATDLTGTWYGKAAPSGNVVGTSDSQTLTNKVINDTVYTLTGTAISADNGGMQVKTLSGSTTLTDSLTNGQTVMLRLVNASTYAVTWPTITWVSANGNVAPTLANDCHVVLWKSGSVLYGAFIGRSV